MQTEEETNDPVNPNHYKSGGIECIEAIKAALTKEEFKGYCKGNAIKYIWREDLKDQNIVDLQKSVWYLLKQIEELEQL